MSVFSLRKDKSPRRKTGFFILFVLDKREDMWYIIYVKIRIITPKGQDDAMNEKLEQYIASGWDKTVRTITREEAEASRDGKLYLPYPYTVPCEDNTLQSMFYWDTYFACRGLLLSGKYDLVANNLRNFIYMIDTYGFIPNGSLKVFLNRSQPPFFGMMLKSYYDATDDLELFRDGLRALKKELEFWYTRRRSANGLNHYSCDDVEDVYIGGVRMYEERTGVVRQGDEEYLGKNVFAEAESGWDFCGRFGGRCLEHNAVDLNSLLFFDEMLLSEYLEGDEADEYAERAWMRREKMHALMRGKDGIFYDYSYTTGKRSEVKSCASFFPIFTGVAYGDKGVDELLSALELDFGLQAAEPVEGNFQWGENNGWACLQLVACEALEACGRYDDARRIAQKYVSLVEKCFDSTGHLWEKYNVRDGSSNAVGEYGTPTMIGWSAGVYLSLKAKL